jgi:hypothetical protein
MTSVTNFDMDIIHRAFNIVITNNNRLLVNVLFPILFPILRSARHLIPQTLHSLSKNNYFELIRSIHYEHKHIISDNILYECFVIASEQGHGKTAQIIRSFDPTNIDKCIFSDINKIPFIKALNNSQYLFLDVLNDIMEYQLSVYLNETEIVKIQYNECQINQIIDKVLADNKINSLNISCDNNVVKHLDKQIINALINQHIDLNEKIFNCKNIYTGEVCSLKFIIIAKHYIDSTYLNYMLKSSCTIIHRDVIAGLLGKNMYPVQILKYRDIMNPLLKLKIADPSNPLIQGMIHESDECQICAGQNDMMISCGHQMCMRCCYDWYIVNEKPLICYVCQQPFVLNECFCLC